MDVVKVREFMQAARPHGHRQAAGNRQGQRLPGLGDQAGSLTEAGPAIIGDHILH